MRISNIKNPGKMIVQIVFLLSFFSFHTFSQTVRTINRTGASSWTAPCGITSVTVECWGGGGGGQRVTGNPSMGGGGSGGGYVRTTYTVVPGVTYNLFVGSGGSGNSGVDGTATWFDNAGSLLAVGGRGAGAATAGFGTGAIAFTTGNIGGVLFSTYGGNGGDGQNLATDVSGGGGSSAGTTAAGNASGMTAGAAPANGFAGAVGLNAGSANGNDGNIGAGGSGGRAVTGTNRNGGAGGNGQIRLTYGTGTDAYCNVLFSANVEPITNVTFLNVNNTTSGTVNGTLDYEDFSSCGTNSVAQGDVFPISVSGNTDGNFTNFIRVYLDWNHDNDFDDAGESFDLGTITNCANCAVTGNITVPCNATLGTTRMRVFKDYNAFPTNSCTSSNNFGQVEDYSVNVTASTGTYVSSTVKQNNTQAVIKGTTNNEVIGIEVVVSANGCRNLTSLSLNTTGTTSTADISNAKIWSTGTSSTFAATTQFGATVAAPNGAFSFNSSIFLSAGTNYLWLTYDVVAGATSNNVIDAQCTSMTIDGVARIPSATAPVGSRPIGGTKNWIGVGAGGAGTDFNTGTNWSPAGVPGVNDLAVMTINATAAPTVTFSAATTTIGGLTISLSGNNRIFTLNVAARTFTVNGPTTATVTAGNASTSLLINVGNGGTINYNGNASFDGASATTGFSMGIYGAGGTTGIINCRGDLNFLNLGAITQAANLPASVIMDGVANQTLSSNNNVATIFPLLQIGNVNSPTVTLAGSTANSIRPNTLTINSTLVIPGANYAINRNAAGGTFTMNAGSFLKLAGTTGGQTGSNFPLNYSTMNLNATSTVEYDAASPQTIYNGVTYGHLTLTNAATKTAGGALTIAGNITNNTGSTFAAGTSLTHNVGGNWLNNGTFSFTTGSTINFNGSTSATISGTSSTLFNNITVNKGSSIATVIDATGPMSMNAGGVLTMTNGLLRLTHASSSAQPGGSMTIAATAGIEVNGGTLVANNGTITNNGLFRVISGTANIGTATGNSLLNQGTSTCDIQGGNLLVAARIQNSAGNYNQSGGTVTLCTVANTSAANANFDMSVTSNVNITNGTIIIRNQNTAGPVYNVINIASGAGVKSISGGTFQIGDASTTAGQTFFVNSTIPLFNFTINSFNAPVVRLVTSDLSLAGTLTMNGGNIDGATNSRNVILTNASAAALSRTSGIINYNLRRAVGSTGASYLFPVGNTTNYTPADLTFTNLTAGNLSVQTVSSEEGNLVAGSAINGAVSVNAHWVLTASGGMASTNYSGTLTYPVAFNDVPAQAANYIIGKNNSGWTYPTVSGTPSSTSISFTSANGFGNLALGECKAAPASVAGSTQNLCGVTSTTLAATAVSAPASGTWSIVSGAGGTITTPTSPTSTFSGTAGTTYVLRWTTEYAGSSCSTNANDVTIVFGAAPTASAGTVTSAFVGDYYTVSGASATNGTILWTHNGTGYYDQTYFPVGNETTLTPTYYIEEGDFGDAVTLTMTVTGTGGCSGNTATATVTLNVSGSPGLWHYQCGTTTPYIDEYIYAYTYPATTQYRFKIDDGVTQETFDTPASVFFFRQFSSAKYNTSYSCQVAAFTGGAWTAFGPICTIATPVVPLTKIQTSQCGVTLANVNTLIVADDVWGVSMYEFSAFDGVTTQTYQSASGTFNLTQLGSYSYGTTYAVRVRTRTNGVWTAFGATCNITTPAQVSQIDAANCGTVLTDNNTDIYCNNIVGTTIYEFRLVNGGTTLTIQKTSRTFKFSQVSGLIAGTNYAVSVRTFTNGVWSAFGPSCNITSASSVAQIQASQCGTILTDNNTDIYCNNVGGATIYEFRLVNGGTTLTIQKPSRTFKFIQVSGVLPGTLYAVSVRTFVSGAWTAFGPACNITSASPLTKISAAQCGSTLTDVATDLYADNVVSATQYRFRVTNGGNVQTIIKTSRTFKLTQLAQVFYGVANVIDVDAMVNGVWIGYGATCNVTTPTLPTTKIQTSQCGITVGSISDLILADLISGATQYRFRLVNVGLSYSQTIDKASRTFRISEFPGLTINTTYDVDVAVFINGGWQTYGAICTLTTPGVLAIMTNDEITEMINTEVKTNDPESETISTGSTPLDEFKAIVFPNPFKDKFGLSLASSSDEVVSLEILDMSGKLIENIEVPYTELSRLSFGENYQSGMYHVKISQGKQIEHLKIMKQ